MALGLSLILNLSGVINFAHGGFLALGAYLAYSLMPYIGFWGALIVAPILTALLGLVVERVLIRPLYGGDPLYGLLLTFGLAYIFEDVTRLIWGAQSVPFQVAGLADDLAAQQPILLPHRLSRVHDHHRRGRRGAACSACSATRGSACASAPERAISTRYRRSASTSRVLRSLNFGIGIYIAGLAGVLAAGLLGLSPTIGATLIMPSFVAIIVGGLGSLLGTLLGGLLIGVASGLAAVYLPLGDRGGDLCDDGPRAAGAPARPARRRRENPLNASARRALDVARLRRCCSRCPIWMARDRRLHRTRHPHRRDGAGGDVAQFPARLHRRAVVRPRRLFRPRRLRHGDGDQICRAETRLLGMAARRRRRDDRGGASSARSSSGGAASISPW